MTIPSKVALGIATLVATGGYLLLCSRSFIVQRSTGSVSVNQLQRAISLAPNNAALHYALGRQLWLQNHNVTAAIAEYKDATRLNPYPADYWIELAAASSVAGNDAVRDFAISRAERAAPYDTAVLWDVANLNLMRGDTIKAFHQMRIASQYGATSYEEYVDLCWKMARNVDTIMAEALPSNAIAYGALLNVTMYLGRVDDAEKVWRCAEALHLDLEAKQSLRYFDFLLSHVRAADAARQWSSYTAGGSGLRGYSSSGSNLIVNPNFVLPVLNAGLDWHYRRVNDISVAIDRSDRGTRPSLAIQFEGNPGDAGIYQLVPVEPATLYRLSAEVRSEFQGVDGPRLAIYDAGTDKRLMMSDAVSGNTGWHEIGDAFRTPDSTTLIAIRIVRSPSISQIRGRVWLARFVLRKAT